MTTAYFPGCSLEGTAREFDESARAICPDLGIELEEVPDWVCCGATPGHSVNEALGVALPVRTLINAARVSRRMMVLCAACYNRCKAANHAMKTRPELRAKVEDAVGEPYAGDVEIVHLLEMLDREVGAERIAERVGRPLTGLRVACYYGCLLLRPPTVMNFDDPENPTIMERVLEPTGAEIVPDWSHKLECCGASFAMSRTDIVERRVGEIVGSARAAGADALIVACPLCQNNCDMRQTGDADPLPVIYFTQLLGLAFGHKPKALGLHRLMTSADRLLERFKGVRT